MPAEGPQVSVVQGLLSSQLQIAAVCQLQYLDSMGAADASCGAAMTDDEILTEAVRRIREQFAPTRILLFGSRATGHARPDSDFDLLVVLPTTTDWRMPGKIRGALRGLDASFDILVHAEVDWQRWRNVRPAFEYQIAREGRDVLHAA